VGGVLDAPLVFLESSLDAVPAQRVWVFPADVESVALCKGMPVGTEKSMEAGIRDPHRIGWAGRTGARALNGSARFRNRGVKNR
jgi:hypothetical protein